MATPSADVTALIGNDPYNRWNIETPVGQAVVMTYSFPTTAATYDTESGASFTAFSAAHQNHIRTALATWSAAAGVTFVEVPDSVNGDIRFSMFDMAGMTNSTGRQLSGFAYYPQSQGIWNGTDYDYRTYHDGIGGDVFMNRNYYASDPSSIAPGIRGYSILLHEMGHALGFEHPFEGEATITPAHDNGIFTIMSYDRPHSTTALGTVDVEALQYLYGQPGQRRDAMWNEARNALEQDGTATSEWIIGWDKSDIIRGGDGDDVIRGRNGDDVLDDGAGADTVQGENGDDTLIMSAAGDADDFDGGSGDDMLVLDGSALTDTGQILTADLGVGVGGLGDGFADVLTSIEHVSVRGAIRAHLTGDSRPNLIAGGAGGDTLIGGDGDDTLDGGAGADVIDGGAGRDVVSYQSATRSVRVDLQNDAFMYNDAVGDTFANIEVFQTGGTVDQLRGDAAGNEFYTGGLSDRLYGRAGDDMLFGETGADALYGGTGADTMTGGDDAGRRDRYIYFNMVESGVGSGNRDVITDFVAGEDRIEISRFDADLTQGFKQGFSFVGGTAFSGAAGELRFEQTGGNTIVQADVTGDGLADFEIELTGLMALTSADFLI